MASFDHELLVELFRHDGGAVVELLRTKLVELSDDGMLRGTVRCTSLCSELMLSQRPSIECPGIQMLITKAIEYTA